MVSQGQPGLHEILERERDRERNGIRDQVLHKFETVCHSSLDLMEGSGQVESSRLCDVAVGFQCLVC